MAASLRCSASWWSHQVATRATATTASGGYHGMPCSCNLYEGLMQHRRVSVTAGCVSLTCIYTVHQGPDSSRGGGLASRGSATAVPAGFMIRVCGTHHPLGLCGVNVPTCHGCCPCCCYCHANSESAAAGSPARGGSGQLYGDGLVEAPSGGATGNG